MWLFYLMNGLIVVGLMYWMHHEGWQGGYKAARDEARQAKLTGGKRGTEHDTKK